MVESPLISLIVTTKNSGRTLEALLKSTAQQTYRQFELIVVDNFSTDDTVEIARRFTGKVYSLGPERSAQRNHGVSQSSGAYVLILDSDMELTTSVLEQCIELVRQSPSTKGLIIPEESFGEGFWAQCKALERSSYRGDDQVEAARFFEREAFLAVGGYDEDLTGPEDWDLSIRFRALYQIARVGSLIRHNEGRLSLQQTVRKKAYYGRSIRRFARKHPGHTIVGANLLLRAAYFRNWKRLTKNPRFLLGMLVMRLSEASGAAFGWLASYTATTTDERQATYK